MCRVASMMMQSAGCRSVDGGDTASEVALLQQTLQARASACCLHKPCCTSACRLLHGYAASPRRGRVQVCELLRRYDLLPARPYGQHSSEQAWRSRANKRRDGAAPAQLFIAGHVQRLRDVVC